MSVQVKVSQRTALILERLRRDGITQDQLIDALERQDVAPLEQITSSQTDFQEWFNYAAEHGEPLVQAVKEGYRITFNTVQGLKMWLDYRFLLEEDDDYTEGEGRLDDIKLSPDQIEQLKNALAVNWVVLEQSEGTISLALRGLLPA